MRRKRRKERKLLDRFAVLHSWLSLLPPFTKTSVLEIIILSYFIYICLLWIKNTRAWQLLKGILVIFAFTAFAVIFRLSTIVWLIERISTAAIIAAVVIFQPELRKALEQLGSRDFFAKIFPEQISTDNSQNTVEEIVTACFEMAKKKTGALIVLEQKQSLREIEDTGIRINGIVSAALLINIFEKNTPLHDGAVVIAHNIVTAATCYLPLSEAEISKAYGTRHRAALGISESTDAVTVVVSEETGGISVTLQGRLIRIQDRETLRSYLPDNRKEKKGAQRPFLGLSFLRRREEKR